MHMGMQMNREDGLTCPRCGHGYAALYFRPRSTCPNCRAEVKTNIRVIAIIETVIGAPFLWMAATLLRTFLHDAAGMLSYALLFFPTLALHLFIVRRFVTARATDTARSQGDH